MGRKRNQTTSPITPTRQVESNAFSPPTATQIKRTVSLDSVHGSPPDPTLIPVPPPLTDHLSFKEKHAKRFLDWQYLSAYLGLGAFGRRALTTALLIGGVGAALSGVGLAGVLIATAVLLAIDITYISIFGHKDRYSIARNEIKLYQLQIEHWIKENKNKSEDVQRLTDILDRYKATKEKDRLAVQDLVKAKKLEKAIGLDNPDINITKELQAMAKRQCPGLELSNLSSAYAINQIRQYTEKNIEECIADLNAQEEVLTQEALILREQRIANEHGRKSLNELSEEISDKTEDLFYLYFRKVNASEATVLIANKNDKAKVYDILTRDILVRRMMAECKINANLLAEEYKKKDTTLGHILGEHFCRMSAVYDNENKRIFAVNRKLTFGQFVKVGFRGLSLSLVLAFVLHSIGVFTFSPGTFLMIGLLGGLSGLVLGFGNSYAQRNKDNLNQKYNDDADRYKEKDRRNKFICLMQILEAKLHYAPTHHAGDRTTLSKEVAHLKRDMLFKVIPIIFLLGSLSRRPLTLLKLMPYSHLFRSIFPLTIIFISMIVLLVYDMGLSTAYIHRQRHSLDMHELQNPDIETDLKTKNIDLILEDKIDTKLKTLMVLKDKTTQFTDIIKKRMQTPLAIIVGNNKIAENIINTLSESCNNYHELRNKLLLGFGSDPKVPEQYRDHHHVRDDILENLEDMQVLKPTFRGMSVGGSLPNLFTKADLTAITVASVLSGIGLSSAFPIPIPIGLALGLVIGLSLGLWMRKIDDRQEALQKQNIKEPEVFHKTDIRRKLNDALDAILLNDFSPLSEGAEPAYAPFTELILVEFQHAPRNATKREFMYLHSSPVNGNELSRSLDFN